jgi:hypothetical protein
MFLLFSQLEMKLFRPYAERYASSTVRVELRFRRRENREAEHRLAAGT